MQHMAGTKVANEWVQRAHSILYTMELVSVVVDNKLQCMLQEGCCKPQHWQPLAQAACNHEIFAI